jgi:lysine 6-dehydrogenase
MKFLVIGSGMMGSALAYDLARSEGVERITLADVNRERAQQTAAAIGSDRVKPVALDVEYFDDVIDRMQGHACAIAATTFRHNFALTKAAIEARVHLLDLGGNDEVVRRQRELHERARNADVLIMPNCGLAPGMANVIAARGTEAFEHVDSIQIRVGGLPQHPKPPFDYQLVFSVEGLLNEYTGKSIILRDYKIQEVDTMTEVETIEFPSARGGFGVLEAFHTSGGTSFLPHMFAGKARELSYKTIRYSGHCERFKALLDLGFASSEPISVGSNLLTARELFTELLKRRLSGSSPDVVLMRVTITGRREGKKQTRIFELIDSYDENAHITAMMRTTAYPTSVMAQLIAQGIMRERGVLTPEQCVPLEPLLEQLRQRAIRIEERWM